MCFLKHNAGMITVAYRQNLYIRVPTTIIASHKHRQFRNARRTFPESTCESSTMDCLKAFVRQRSADQDAGLAHAPAEQAPAHAHVSSVSQGSTGLNMLLRMPPAAANSAVNDTKADGARTTPGPVPDLEAQLENISTSGTQAECRICLLAGSTEQELYQPCACAGTMGYTHAACLAAWVQEKGSLTCELCKQQYKEPYKQALAFCLRASWGEEQQQQPRQQQQQQPAAAGMAEGQEAPQTVSQPSSWCGCLLRMSVGQWFCLLVVTVFLVTFAGFGVGVGMSRSPAAAPVAAPRNVPAPAHASVVPGQIQVVTIDCNPIAGARFGICRMRRQQLPLDGTANSVGAGQDDSVVVPLPGGQGFGQSRSRFKP